MQYAQDNVINAKIKIIIAMHVLLLLIQEIRLHVGGYYVLRN